MSESPLISVVLPVYNAEPYLKLAIDSILKQSYEHFEFIIINDGSTDDSETIILSYTDSRIKYHKQENKGLGATLNVGLGLSRGKYIARQDQDDISHPERFQKQVYFLENNPNVLLLGTRAKVFKDDGTVMGYHNHATNSAVLKFDLLFDNPFVHSSVMFRRSAIDSIGNYTVDRDLYEDFDLWSRFAEIGDVANLPEVLLDYRHHDKGMSKNFSNFKEFALYNQGVKNLKKITDSNSYFLTDLIALYHLKKDKYKGSSVDELKGALNSIAQKIASMYPADKDPVYARAGDYEKVIRYKLNELKLQNNGSAFNKLMVKIQNKLLGLHPFVING